MPKHSNSFRVVINVITEELPENDLTLKDVKLTHDDIFKAIESTLDSHFKDHTFSGMAITNITLKKGYNKYAPKYKKKKP